MKDNFGNRIKEYEGQETLRSFMPLLPIYARLDGRGFSKFTKTMNRPYDERMSNTMTATMLALVDQTEAKIGYTQSDEISLVWYNDKQESMPMFNGKIQKLCSILASIGTVEFNYYLKDYFGDDYESYRVLKPHFDCRVFQLPNLVEAANTVLWREQDATKNAISMAAHSMFPHNELQNKTGAEKQEMMYQKFGINFNDYPAFFKRGVFGRKETYEGFLDDSVWNKIPDNKKPECRIITRSRMVRIELDKPFSKVSNRVNFIFNKEDPLYNE